MMGFSALDDTVFLRWGKTLSERRSLTVRRILFYWSSIVAYLLRTYFTRKSNGISAKGSSQFRRKNTVPLPSFLSWLQTIFNLSMQLLGDRETKVHGMTYSHTVTDKPKDNIWPLKFAFQHVSYGKTSLCRWVTVRLAEKRLSLIIVNCTRLYSSKRITNKDLKFKEWRLHGAYQPVGRSLREL